MIASSSEVLMHMEADAVCSIPLASIGIDAAQCQVPSLASHPQTLPAVEHPVKPEASNSEL